MRPPPVTSSWGVRDDVAALLRRVVVYASMLISLRYIVWRVLESMPTPAWTAFNGFALGLIAVEIANFYITTTGVDFPRDRRARPSLKPFTINWRNRTPEANARIDWYGSNAPPVEIFIPTYDEAWSILEKAIVGATSQMYPNFRVWVLDDGRREWLREKAEQYGANYISRCDNGGYKAGNINGALRQLQASGVRVHFIALLDADFIARPRFLRRTMALMAEPDVGIVQTPQAYYNADPFQQTFGVENWPEEHREWFDVDEPALDATDDALCCGTACLIRGRALEAIGGGFPTESVCEDTLCSARMKRAGWRTVYLSERLSVGLAAEGVDEWFTQRVRWLTGDLQNRRLNGTPQQYFDRLNYWLSYFHLTIKAAKDLGWVLALAVFWYSGRWVIDASPWHAAAYVLPIWCSSLSWVWLTGGRKNFIVVGPQFKLQRFIWLTVPIWFTLSRALPRFEVTQKGRRRASLQVHWRLLAGHAIIILGLSGGLAIALLGGGTARNSPWFAVNTALTIYLVIETLVAIAPTFERRQRRTDDRYRTTELVELRTDEATMVVRATNISLGGVLLDLNGARAPQTAVMRLSDASPVRVQLVWERNRHAAYRLEGTDHHREMIQKIYCGDGYVPLPDRWRMRDALNAILVYLASPARAAVRALARVVRVS